MNVRDTDDILKYVRLRALNNWFMVSVEYLVVQDTKKQRPLVVKERFLTRGGASFCSGQTAIEAGDKAEAMREAASGRRGRRWPLGGDLERHRV